MNIYQWTSTIFRLVCGCFLLGSCVVVAQQPLGTEFNYQGFLQRDGVPIDEKVDLRFSLWDTAENGTTVADTIERQDIVVNAGLFATELDFGLDPFAKDTALWLQVQVREPGANTYRTLLPRRKLAATPYALRALTGPISGQFCPIGQSVIGVSSDNELICADTSTGACAGVSCLPHQRCESLPGPSGQEVPICVDTCDGFVCPTNEQCTLRDVACVTAPCPPIATCEPTAPADPCMGMCSEEQECKTVESGDSSTAYCADSCDLKQCAADEICKLRPVSCITEPCPPIATCIERTVDLDPCAELQCAANQVCKSHTQSNGEVVGYCADTCDGVECLRGEKCDLVNVLCVTEPCPPIARCVADDTPDACGQPIVQGPCRAAIPRWGFDEQAGQCTRFIYGGCGGNNNNFLTRNACENQCGNQVDACELDKESGPCNALFPRWFHNSDSNSCERFIYGGCAGNDNNFASRADCNAACKPEPVEQCEQPADTGQCKAIIPKWFHNSDTEQCERFNYGGCGGNDNRFDTQAECVKSCDVQVDACQLPAETGPCKGNEQQWFHNRETGSCEQFAYSGCGGNENRFPTKAACESSCDVQTNRCELTQDPGPCRGAFPRWSHNSETNACERFIYGGCGGNENNFQTLQACQSACNAQVDVCSLPSEVGPCDAAIPSWFHNEQSGRCEEFVYGGCLGNGNRFATQAECEKSCDVPATNVCELPAEVGPCRALIPRYFFDSNSNSCEQFNYGGCQGNSNNFLTIEECNRACPSARALTQ